MACIGSVILAKMLEQIGLDSLSYIDKFGVKDKLLGMVFDLYGKNGDMIALQYAGSEALHKATFKMRNGDWKPENRSNGIISVKRYFNNVLNDNEKQRTLWIFLGDYIPNIKEKKQLWDLDIKEAEKLIGLDFISIANGSHSTCNLTERLGKWVGTFSIPKNQKILSKIGCTDKSIVSFERKYSSEIPKSIKIKSDEYLPYMGIRSRVNFFVKKLNLIL